MRKKQIIEKLRAIVYCYSGGYDYSDAYETNARGGSSDIEIAKADGRDEVCDEIRDLINELER